MKIRVSDLWHWEGTIDRGPYLLVGILGFALKHNLDRLVATAIFGRPWGLFNYWIPPGKVVRISELSDKDQLFFASLLVLALPFIWTGVVLTLRRLRAVGLSTWLVTLFFLPVVNLIFFLLLSLLPSRPALVYGGPQRGGRLTALLDRVIPDEPVGSATMALVLTLPFGVAATKLGTVFFSRYGWGLFVALPFALGLASVLLYGYHRPRSYAGCLLVSWLSILFTALALFALVVEGVICLVMAAPIGVVLAAIGGSLGYLIQRRPWSQSQVIPTLLLLVLAIPGVMGAEAVSCPEPPLLTVRTAIEIEAAPKEVWQRVVSFTELPEPTDWVFRLGIAYPMRAEIYGRGVGAVRHCVFSSGAFVEPITVWDEPWVLQFSVTANPPPMQEWTPFAEIHAPHLRNFLVSQGGQFLLLPLPGGRTRVEATTWYHHTMWPATYWQLWSDWIIHRIHRRVLQHIQQLTERNPKQEARRGE